MSNVKYEIDYTSVTDLQEKLSQIPGKGEEIINRVMYLDGISILTDDITRFIPTSNKKKKHAADANWSKSTKFNLGFEIISRGGAANNKNSFGYLIFPDEGRGSKNPKAHDFTGKGLEQSTPKIMEILNAEINKKILEVLK